MSKKNKQQAEVSQLNVVMYNAILMQSRQAIDDMIKSLTVEMLEPHVIRKNSPVLMDNCDDVITAKQQSKHFQDFIKENSYLPIHRKDLYWYSFSSTWYNSCILDCAKIVANMIHRDDADKSIHIDKYMQVADEIWFVYRSICSDILDIIKEDAKDRLASENIKWPNMINYTLKAGIIGMLSKKPVYWGKKMSPVVWKHYEYDCSKLLESVTSYSNLTHHDCYDELDCRGYITPVVFSSTPVTIFLNRRPYECNGTAYVRGDVPTLHDCTNKCEMTMLEIQSLAMVVSSLDDRIINLILRSANVGCGDVINTHNRAYIMTPHSPGDRGLSTRFIGDAFDIMTWELTEAEKHKKVKTMNNKITSFEAVWNVNKDIEIPKTATVIYQDENAVHYTTKSRYGNECVYHLVVRKNIDQNKVNRILIRLYGGKEFNSHKEGERITDYTVGEALTLIRDIVK